MDWFMFLSGVCAGFAFGIVFTTVFFYMVLCAIKSWKD